MQIQVKKLREVLELLGPAVPSKPTLEALRSVLLKDGAAMATNLEVAVAVDLPEVDGEYLLPFREAAELLKRIPWHEMLNLEQKEGQVHLAWSGGEASYTVHTVEDYPPFVQVKPVVEQAVNGDTLVPALLSVVDYCNTKQDRPVLTGVAVTLGDSIQIAAGDGFRMAIQVLPISLPAADGMDSVVIPSGAVRILGHLWDRVPREVPVEGSLVHLVLARRQLQLALGKDRLEARFGPVTLSSQLVMGTPPNFTQLIPEDPPLKVQVLAPDFERAVRQMATAARDGSGVVRLTWSETAMTVTAKSTEKADLQVRIPVNSEGGEGRVAMNINYLLGYLRGKEGMVTMGVRDVSSPVRLDYGASPLVVMMPMFVQW